MTNTLLFWTTGDDMTRLIRDMWNSGEIDKAVNLCSSVPLNIAIDICTGKLKLSGDTREGDHTLDVVEDKQETYFTVENQIDTLEKMFVYFTDYNSALKRQMNIISSFHNSESRKYKKRKYGAPSPKDIDKSIYLNNEIKVKKALKGLEILYPLVNKSISNLPIYKLGEYYSTIESERIENTIRENEEEKAWRDTYNKKEMKLNKYRISDKPPIKPEPSKITNKDVTNGWIDLDGQFYCCGFQGHRELADDMKYHKIIPEHLELNNENFLERQGWCKLSANQIISYSYKRKELLTKKQVDTIVGFFIANRERFVKYGYAYNFRQYKTLQEVTEAMKNGE